MSHAKGGDISPVKFFILLLSVILIVILIHKVSTGHGSGPLEIILWPFIFLLCFLPGVLAGLVGVSLVAFPIVCLGNRFDKTGFRIMATVGSVAGAIPCLRNIDLYNSDPAGVLAYAAIVGGVPGLTVAALFWQFVIEGCILKKT